MPAIASQQICAATPSTAAPTARTTSLVAITRIRRGAQNSSATIERVDHSAPIHVAPIRKASAAASPAKPMAPAVPASARSKGAFGRKPSTPPMSSSVSGGPQYMSGSSPSGIGAFSRQSSRPTSFSSRIWSTCACAAA
jgi:hypothetical protein